MATNLPQWLQQTIEPTVEERPMWITCEHQHFLALQVPKCDTIYVVRRGSGDYRVIGTIGDRDILIKGDIGTAAEATEFAQTLVNGL